MDSKPALQTSSTVNPIDISVTEKATHVYVKNENTVGLQPKFCGPYVITSRPSRSVDLFTKATYSCLMGTLTLSLTLVSRGTLLSLAC